jgi:radical SAM superfamily enzyme YgiQ (UPF0313 family)
VLKEIEVCYKEYAIREIDFFDAVFFLDKPAALEFLRGLQRLKLDVEWSCRSRVDVVDKDILEAAAEAGCRQIYYGIESAHQAILDKMEKRIAVNAVKTTIALTKEHGIRTMGFFMVGNDGDTPDSVRKTMEFAQSIDLDFIQVCQVIAKPGTVLHQRLNSTAGVDPWQAHIAGEQLRGRLPTPWCGLTEEEIRLLTQEFYFKFYFRFSVITKLLVRLKSLAEMRRYLRAGLKFIMQMAGQRCPS